MKNTDLIKEIKQRIANLQQEKARIDNELVATQNYLKVLQGKSVNTKTVKANQTPEAIAKMKKAQKERQEREKRQRYKAIIDFLAKNSEAKTEVIANLLKLSLTTTKRYLRSIEEIEEVKMGIWRIKDEDEDFPF